MSRELSDPDAGRGAGFKTPSAAGLTTPVITEGFHRFSYHPVGNLILPPGVIRTGARCVVRDGPEGRKGGENASHGDGFRGVFEGAENFSQRM